MYFGNNDRHESFQFVWVSISQLVLFKIFRYWIYKALHYILFSPLQSLTDISRECERSVYIAILENIYGILFFVSCM